MPYEEFWIFGESQPRRVYAPIPFDEEYTLRWDEEREEMMAKFTKKIEEDIEELEDELDHYLKHTVKDALKEVEHEVPITPSIEWHTGTSFFLPRTVGSLQPDTGTLKQTPLRRYINPYTCSAIEFLIWLEEATLEELDDFGNASSRKIRFRISLPPPRYP